MQRTQQRQVILDLILRAPDHPTAAQVFQRARKILPRVGQATVYRSLAHLVEEGLIRELRVGDVTQYDRRTDRHDHLVCRQCGCVEDVEAAAPSNTLHEIAAAHDFVVESHHTEVSGLCRSCR